MRKVLAKTDSISRRDRSIRKKSIPFKDRPSTLLCNASLATMWLELNGGRVALLELGRQLSARRGSRPPSTPRSFGADRPCCRRQSHASRNGRHGREGFTLPHVITHLAPPNTP